MKKISEKLLREWDYERNNLLNIFPSEITPGSNKKVWWKCDKGHSWQSAIYSRRNDTANCPYCSNQKVLTGFNDLVTTNPELLIDWNYEKNENLDPKTISAGSHKTIWWKCHICGHEWEAPVGTRKQGNAPCPYCRVKNKVVISGENDLYTTRQDLILDWDYKKNKINPKEISPNSTKLVWWKCHVCGHEWQKQINQRNLGMGCQKCGYKDSANTRLNRLIDIRGSLEQNNPELLIDWDYKKNKIDPKEVLSTSEKIVWWKCHVCGHEWKASISRIVKGSGCSVCSKIKSTEKLISNLLIEKGSLAQNNPYYFKEWDYEKNNLLNLDPNKILCSSKEKAWWKCQRCGHEWQSSVVNRNSGVKCPKCVKELSTSFPEKAIFFYIKKHIVNVQENVKLPELNGMEIDIYIPKYKLGIEYDGENFHRNKKRDSLKNKLCKEHNITLIRIREKNCPRINRKSINYTLKSNNYDYELIGAIEFIINYINQNCNRKIKTNINIKRDKNKIYELYFTLPKNNSIVNVNPTLLQLWDYEKNKGIDPKFLSVGSDIKVWWKCDKGHEWEASVSDISKGNRCPYCSNHKVLVGFNDLKSVFPYLLKEWDYDKNYELGFLPEKVIYSSSKDVWWKCEKGHEWLSSIRQRTQNKAGCPYCSHHRVLTGFNDLATTNPELAIEWNYKKNGILKPTDVINAKNKKVWWKCQQCGYEWQSTINNRKYGKGCPICSRYKK